MDRGRCNGTVCVQSRSGRRRRDDDWTATERQANQCVILRLARRNHDVQSGKHRGDISGYNASARPETLGSDAIEERVSRTAVLFGKHCYRVLIRDGLLEQLGARVRRHLHRKTCAIISDGNVAPLFADRVKKVWARRRHGPLTIEAFPYPSGEPTLRALFEVPVR